MEDKKIYTILGASYEYNDEIYYNDSETFIEPNTFYTDVDKAIADKNQMEYNAFRGENIFNYCYSVDEILNYGISAENVYNFFKDTLEIEWDSNIPVKATDDQIKELMKLINIRFYKMVELNNND